MKIRLLILNCLVVSVFTGCNSYKNVPYFQDLDRTRQQKEEIKNLSVLTIQPGDLLGISVSSLNPEASAVFNYNLNTVTGLNSNSESPVMGYLVDQEGNIQLPLIGKYKASGQSTSALEQGIQSKLTTYLKEPVVNLRLLNFRISVMGDVTNPGVYKVQNERITLNEALSLAGDLNITAKRDNIMLIREQNGTREYIPIDLRSKGIFNSPYYYLKSNDILYVQPDRTKYAAVDRSYRNVSLILSALSIVAIVLTRY